MEQNAVELPLHDQLLAWLEEHKKQVLYGCVAAAVAGAGIGFYNWNQEQKRIQSGEAVTRAMIVPAGARTLSAETLLKVANEHAGTVAGSRALIQAAGVLFSEGKFAEAQTQFQRFLREYPDSSFAYEAAFGNAAALEALGKTDDAAKAYADVTARNPSSPVASRAKLSQGRILESQGKLAEARDIFESVARNEPGSPAASEAAYRAEMLKAKLPAQVPPAVRPPAVSSTNLLSK